MTSIVEDTLQITFVSDIKGLNNVPECIPKLTQKFVPNWWKDMPLKTPNPSPTFDLYENNFHTIKACPSYPEYFSQGVIVPMWVDTILSYDDKSGSWKWQTSDSSFKWDIHQPEQLTVHKKPNYQGHEAPFVFKAISPWRIITQPGVSVYQFPVFYEFNSDFSVLPGIIRTDQWHQINQQVLFHSKNKEIYIKRGTPFVHYIPFFRTRTELKHRDATSDDVKLFADRDMLVSTKFPGNNEYLNQTKRKINND